MNYPKQELSLQNEREMKKWLRKNENVLPKTLYGLSKAIGWSYGQTRGTLNRLEEKTGLIVKQEVIDPEKKRFKIFVALNGGESHDRLKERAKSKSIKIFKAGKSPSDSNGNSKNLKIKIDKLSEDITWMMNFFQKHASYLQKKINSEESKRFREIVERISP